MMVEIYWTAGIVLAIVALCTLFYKIGQGRNHVSQVASQTFPVSVGGNGKVSKKDYDARVLFVDSRIDYVHKRIDEQKDVLSEIREGVGYIRGKIE